MGIEFIGENGGGPGVRLKNCHDEDAHCGTAAAFPSPPGRSNVSVPPPWIALRRFSLLMQGPSMGT
jgi:hypothetical protein